MDAGAWQSAGEGLGIDRRHGLGNTPDERCTAKRRWLRHALIASRSKARYCTGLGLLLASAHHHALTLFPIFSSSCPSYVRHHGHKMTVQSGSEYPILGC